MFWCKYLSSQGGLTPLLFADDLECTSSDAGTLLRAARFADRKITGEASTNLGQKRSMVPQKHTVRGRSFLPLATRSVMGVFLNWAS